MRILVVAKAVPTDYTGGISKSLQTELDYLVERGHDVTVLTQAFDESAPRRETHHGYEHYRFEPPAGGFVSGNLYPPATYRGLVSRLETLTASQEFDVAYTHNAMLSSVFARVTDVPYVRCFHAPVTEEVSYKADAGNYGWKTPLVRVANGIFRRHVTQGIDRATTVVTRSPFVRSRLREIHGDHDVEIVPLAVDTERYPFAPDPAAAREQLDISHRGPLLFTARRLVPRVGVGTLVDAMETVESTYSDARLIVAGTGPLADDLERQAARLGLDESIRFTGFIPEERIPDYYRAADLSIVPTQALEGFGLSTLESMSCGTPVLATPVGANPEVLEPLDPDLIADGTDATALASSLTALLEETDRRSLRGRCREYVEDRFTPAVVGPQIEDVLAAASERHMSASRD